MDYSRLRLCMLVIILGLFANCVESDQGNNNNNTNNNNSTTIINPNYITWDDMKLVNPIRLHYNIHTSNYSSNTTSSVITWRYDSYNNGNFRIIVVDKSGRGDSVTVQGAVDMIPHNNMQRVKIYILPGIYREKVYVPATKPYISFIGNETRSSETVITYDDCAATIDNRTGSVMGTYNSASVFIESDYFCAIGITFENSYTATENRMNGNQAVALRISGKNAMFFKVRFLGAQDTLLDQSGEHYFLKSYIQGTVDFIFGNARSIYRKCVINSTAQHYGAIAAHKRTFPDENTGFSFINCTIRGTGTNRLGRAWGNYSRIVFSYCHFDDSIDPSGWSDWNDPTRQKTVVFGEYQCSGRGANRRYRVPWSKSLSNEEATPFMDTKFIDENEQWLKLRRQ